MNPSIKIRPRQVAIIVLACLASSCAVHPDPYVRQGRVGGALIGAGAGAIIGNNVKGISKGEGAIAGAILGGIIGDARGKANSAYYRRPRPYYY
jgi:uncharacterized protein YcfJ